MQIKIEKNGQETIVRINGELDTVATTEQAEELQQVLGIANEALVIDCSELEYISSAGLRFFSIRIKSLNEDVSDIFRMSGFQNIFQIED